jgi:hypothetical protein
MLINRLPSCRVCREPVDREHPGAGLCITHRQHALAIYHLERGRALFPPTDNQQRKQSR